MTKLLRNLIFYFFVFGLIGCNKLVNTQLVSQEQTNQSVNKIEPLTGLNLPTNTVLSSMQTNFSSCISSSKAVFWRFLKKHAGKQGYDWFNCIMNFNEKESYIPYNKLFCNASDFVLPYALSGVRWLLDPCYNTFVSKKIVDPFMECLYRLCFDPKFRDMLSNNHDIIPGLTIYFKNIDFIDLIFKVYSSMPDKWIADQIVYVVSLAVIYFKNHLIGHSLIFAYHQNMVDMLIFKCGLDLLAKIAKFACKESVKHEIAKARNHLWEYVSKPDAVDNLIKLSQNFDDAARNLIRKLLDLRTALK